MKKLFTLLAVVLLTAHVFAQSPEKMSYQAVIRNSSNALVASTNVGMQLSILQGTADGTAVYVETQIPTTNANGLVSVEIGSGAVVSGNFSAIDWANGPYFIKTETDPTGGTNYTITGTSQLLSVPYALFAQKAGTVELSDEQIAVLKGVQGLAGVQGAKGADGENGIDGKSAYQIAQDNGFEGTETEWIGSLKGIQGAQGIPGADGQAGIAGAAGLNGADGQDGKSAYDIALDNGFVGTEAEWTISLKGATGAKGEQGPAGIDGVDGEAGKDGANGKSAYQSWIAEGNFGSESDFLSYLQGRNGQSAYELWVAEGNEGALSEYLAIKGEKGDAGKDGENGTDGKSAYDLWVDAGNLGTVSEFLATKGEKGDAGSDGKSAYEIAQDNGFVGTEAAWIASLKGEQGVAGIPISVNGVVQVGGAITLTKADLGLANVDNTADADKPISTATQRALDNKVALTGNQTIAGNKTFTGTTTVATPVNAQDAATKAYVDALQNQLQMLQNTLIAGGLVSDYDGNAYNTIRIGNQTWMAENLKTTTYNDGTAIPNVRDNEGWAATLTTGGAQCDYSNKPSNTTTYGKLYNWYAVNTAKLCPTGWHVPTDAEWTSLTTSLGSTSVAGGKLKETGTTHWKTPNTGATNEKGFTALPGGYRYYGGAFGNIGSFGHWWSATEDDVANAYGRGISYFSSTLVNFSNNKELGFSVRCVKD